MTNRCAERPWRGKPEQLASQSRSNWAGLLASWLKSAAPGPGAASRASRFETIACGWPGHSDINITLLSPSKKAAGLLSFAARLEARASSCSCVCVCVCEDRPAWPAHCLALEQAGGRPHPQAEDSCSQILPAQPAEWPAAPRPHCARARWPGARPSSSTRWRALRAGQQQALGRHAGCRHGLETIAVRRSSAVGI